MLTRRPAPDDGSITVLVIGYSTIAAVLIVVGVDVSKVFLAERALAAAADAAALAAAEGVDTAAVYDGSGLQCGRSLPLDQTRAAALAAASLDAVSPNLDRTLAAPTAVQTSVVDGTVSVEVSSEVAVPFGRVLGWLDPSRPDGRVTVTATSHAHSPVAGGAC